MFNELAHIFSDDDNQRRSREVLNRVSTGLLLSNSVYLKLFDFCSMLPHSLAIYYIIIIIIIIQWYVLAEHKPCGVSEILGSFLIQKYENSSEGHMSRSK